MKAEHSKKVNATIETLCKQGCSQVNRIIDNAKNGNEPEELSAFTKSEVSEIIDELSKIMSVYDGDNDDSDCTDVDK